MMIIIVVHIRSENSFVNNLQPYESDIMCTLSKLILNMKYKHSLTADN